MPHCLQAETYQNLCTRKARAAQENVMNSSAWTDLKQQCEEKVVLAINQKMLDMISAAVQGATCVSFSANTCLRLQKLYDSTTLSFHHVLFDIGTC